MAALFYILFANIANLGIKLIFSLVVAFPLNGLIHFVDGNFWNYLIGFGILAFVTMFMYWLPRSKNSLNFGINFAWLTCFSLWAVRDLAPDVVDWVNFKFLEYTVLTLCCAFWAFTGMKHLVEKRDLPTTWLRHIDRAISSVIMTILMVYFATNMFAVTLESVLLWILAAVFCIGWFVLDLFAYDKFADVLSAKSKISEEEREQFQNPLLYFKSEKLTKEQKKELREKTKQEQKEWRKEQREEWRAEQREARRERRHERWKESLRRDEERRIEEDYRRSQNNGWW